MKLIYTREGKGNSPTISKCKESKLSVEDSRSKSSTPALFLNFPQAAHKGKIGTEGSMSYLARRTALASIIKALGGICTMALELENSGFSKLLYSEPKMVESGLVMPTSGAQNDHVGHATKPREKTSKAMDACGIPRLPSREWTRWRTPGCSRLLETALVLAWVQAVARRSSWNAPEGRLRILACAIEGKASTGEGGSRPWGLRRLREMERLANRLG